MRGSGLFIKAMAQHPHLLTHGVAGEVGDLRLDVAQELAPLTATTVEEFTALAAASSGTLHAATATTVAPQTVTSFLSGGQATLAAHPRSIRFTTAGGTPSHAPNTAVVTGKDVNGHVVTETFAVPQFAFSLDTATCFSSLISVAFAAGQGTNATVAIGIGLAVGLTKKLKTRAGFSGLAREVVKGFPATPVPNLTVQEWTDPFPGSTTDYYAAEPMTVAIKTLSLFPDSFLVYPGNLSFTTGGTTPSDAPATVVVTGTDINGNPLTETITLAQTAATVFGVKCFRSTISAVFAAADGPGATMDIGSGHALGLSKPIKFRAGATHPIQEIALGVVVTTGTFADSTVSPPNGSYTPATPVNNANDYAVYYETGLVGGTMSMPGSVSQINNGLQPLVSAPNGSYTPGVAADGATNYTIYYEYDATAP